MQRAGLHAGPPAGLGVHPPSLAIPAHPRRSAAPRRNAAPRRSAPPRRNVAGRAAARNAPPPSRRQELVDKTDVALKALGFASSHKVIEEFVGAAATSTGDPADVALALATRLFFPTEGSLAFNCYPCVAACERALKHLSLPVNPRPAALAAARLVRAMDAALRRRSSSLSDAVHGMMVRMRLSPPATGVDARRAVASHLLAVYATMYATKQVSPSQFRTHVTAFLGSNRADLAPLVAALVRHTATDMNVPSVVCQLCSSRAMPCVQKAAIAAAALAVATAAATAVRRHRR